MALPLSRVLRTTSLATLALLVAGLLKQDAHRTRHRRAKAPQKRRTARKSVTKQESRPVPQAKPAQTQTEAPPPAVAPVPVPVPAPRPEPPTSKEAPLPKEEKQAVPEKLPEPKPEAAKPETGKPQTPPPQSGSDAAKPAPDGRVYQVSCPALITGEVEGKLLPPIEDGPSCGVHSPLRLTAIGKDEPLKFAHAITTNCAMAMTLAQWSTDVRQAARNAYGPNVKITAIGTGSDYQCRKVNGETVGRISEHAFANALDIMSFTFSDGSKTELTTGWNGSEKEKDFWRAVHDASCKRFMTVIGPDGDAAHRTNMHLDQGCHGKSCLARICQ